MNGAKVVGQFEVPVGVNADGTFKMGLKTFTVGGGHGAVGDSFAASVGDYFGDEVAKWTPIRGVTPEQQAYLDAKEKAPKDRTPAENAMIAEADRKSKFEGMSQLFAVRPE